MIKSCDMIHIISAGGTKRVHDYNTPRHMYARFRTDLETMLVNAEGI
jgi:hypothetical protein